MREWIKLFYYNVFALECYTQALIANAILGRPELTTLSKYLVKQPVEKDKSDEYLEVVNNPKGGITLTFTCMHVGLLIFFFLLSWWNFICGILHLGLHSYWYKGMYVAVILVMVQAFFWAPGDHKKYLKDFTKFAKRSKVQKRKSALVTLLIVIAVFAMLVSSMLFYMRSMH